MIEPKAKSQERVNHLSNRFQSTLNSAACHGRNGIPPLVLWGSLLGDFFPNQVPELQGVRMAFTREPLPPKSMFFQCADEEFVKCGTAKDSSTTGETITRSKAGCWGLWGQETRA